VLRATRVRATGIPRLEARCAKSSANPLDVFTRLSLEALHLDDPRKLPARLRSWGSRRSCREMLGSQTADVGHLIYIADG
jgi:hypothetical protein